MLKCSYCKSKNDEKNNSCVKCGASLCEEESEYGQPVHGYDFVNYDKVSLIRTNFPVFKICYYCNSGVRVEHCDLIKINGNVLWLCPTCSKESPIDVDYTTEQSINNKFRLTGDHAFLAFILLSIAMLIISFIK